MKRVLLVISVMLLNVCVSFAQGVPFLRNYLANEYHAHNRNFDVVTDEEGNAYFANFEGLLYYDNVEWRMIHTSDITRVTVVYRDQHNVIWTGGYNYFGYLAKKPNGELYLQRVGTTNSFFGEVGEIWEENGELLFFVNNGNIYKVKDGKITLKKKVANNLAGVGLSDVIKTDALEDENQVVVLEDVTQTVSLGNGMKVSVKKGNGLSFTDEKDKEFFTVTEANGLCTDNVVWVAYDGHGTLWGATDNGIFSISVPSAFSHFSSHEGLTGDVRSIEEYEGRMYVGTSRALFRQEGRRFVAVPGINHACWDLKRSDRGLLAATANGVYCVSGTAVRQLTTTTSMALLTDGSQFYSGEMDGVFLIQLSDNSRKKVCGLEKVNRISKDVKGNIWLQSMYGDVWCKEPTANGFKPYRENETEIISTIVPLNDKMEVVATSETKPFSYPLFSYLDESGVTWLTDNEGKALYRWKAGKRLEDMNQLLYPFANMSVRAMYKRQHEVWLGGDDDLRVIDVSQNDPILQHKPRLRFRTVRLNGDSILWGGFGEMPKSIPQLESHERNLRFTYAVDYSPLVGVTLYRHRLNGGKWSAWDNDKDAEFLNLPYGSYTIEIQALLATGEMTEVVSMDFDIAYPFYMRWYMNVIYLLFVGLLVYALFRYRLHRLSQEKIRLESVVQERTAEVVKQKDEIEEKSKSLEIALDELNNAQNELIRQEKMATVGKLTQGLIDRILNPLNYINNFAKLSEGLVKDIEANIEDDKDKMDGENYEDTIDVLGMLTGNLQKVSEHGQNTTRTLKAMEEMLKDRSGGIVPMDLVPLLRQDEAMLNNYYADDIRQYGIKTKFDIPQAAIAINGNADQLSKTMMSILANAVYAVVKKAQREQYQPEITVSVNTNDAMANISIRDNGIGIEPTIINKIFDPFFTTKTTGEAAGVGLYLSHEIIQNHHGTISVKSEKNVYTEFIITLPIS